MIFPIVGYNNNMVNTLRVWDAEAIDDFQLDSFDKGDYHAVLWSRKTWQRIL